MSSVSQNITNHTKKSIYPFQRKNKSTIPEKDQKIDIPDTKTTALKILQKIKKRRKPGITCEKDGNIDKETNLKRNQKAILEVKKHNN